MSLLEELSPELQVLKDKLEWFVLEQCQPAEEEYERHLENRVGASRWTMDAIPPCIERLKKEAKELGLWNLFLPHSLPPSIIRNPQQQQQYSSTLALLGRVLTNREYGILCEVMGMSFLAPEACNCSAPDTGNMEVLLKHGTYQQQQQYLQPLLEGKIRSAFLMTEPQVASSDATNIQTKLTKIISNNNNNHSQQEQYILNGRKWWSTGAMDPRCQVALVLAKMDYSHPNSPPPPPTTHNNRHSLHTVVLVPMEKVRMVRPLTVFGVDDAPHGHAEVVLDNIVLGKEDLILGEGRGFEIAQSRLGPGRIHHCMRAVGMAKRCYQIMLQRSVVRSTFGKPLYQHGMSQDMIAQSFADLDAARLLTLDCAAAIDERGAHRARDKIASIKFAVPHLTHQIVNRAIQMCGGAGVSQDFPLARLYTGLRTLQIADGPDAVHKRTLALLQVKQHLQTTKNKNKKKKSLPISSKL